MGIQNFVIGSEEDSCDEIKEGMLGLVQQVVQYLSKHVAHRQLEIKHDC